MQPPHPLLAQAAALGEAGRVREAMLLLARLAAEGEPRAMHAVAEAHWHGNALPRDLPRARELFRRAAEAGHEQAGEAWTNLLASGFGGHRDWKKALKRLREEGRADRARARTRSLIEKMKLTGEGDPQSLPAPRRLSEAPHVLLFPRLLSPAECDYLCGVAEPAYRPSTVGFGQPDPIRTSDAAVVHWLAEDPAIHALNRRLAAAAGSAAECGEPLQILRYRPGQQYRTHLDYVPGAANQRVLTALVWLSDGYEGGETAFVRTGLVAKGKKGDALLFRNTLEDGRADPMAEHAGLPITRGVKLLASRWIRAARHVP